MTGVMLIVLFTLLVLTVPITVCLGTACIAAFTASGMGSNMIAMLAQSTVTSIDSFSLLAIPFFMLVGTLMEKTGIAQKLVDVANMITG